MAIANRNLLPGGQVASGRGAIAQAVAVVIVDGKPAALVVMAVALPRGRLDDVFSIGRLPHRAT